MTLARSGADIATVVVRADSCEEAIDKAERYLRVNIYARIVVSDGVHQWPPGSDREGMTVERAAELGRGRIADAPVINLTEDSRNVRAR